MRLSLEDLKETVRWLEGNTNEAFVEVTTDDVREMRFQGFDRNGNEVLITVYSESNLLPKLRRTETLSTKK